MGQINVFLADLYFQVFPDIFFMKLQNFSHRENDKIIFDPDT